jgi:hypothetical protein
MSHYRLSGAAVTEKEKSRGATMCSTTRTTDRLEILFSQSAILYALFP